MEPKVIKCPTCKKPTEYSPKNPSRPFCSERCRLLDLGDWASNKYKVAGSESAAKEDKSSEPEDHEEH